MGLKNFLRRKRNEFHGTIGETLSPATQHMSDRLRLKARMRLCNQWASSHPKSTFAILVCSISCCIAIDLMWDTSTMSAEPSIAEIASVDGIFQSMERVNALKQMQRGEYRSMGELAMSIKRKTDSLVSLPVKTSKDSVDIITGYKQLETIAKMIQYEEN